MKNTAKQTDRKKVFENIFFTKRVKTINENKEENMSFLLYAYK